MKFLLVEGERIFKRAAKIGCQVGLDGVDVEKREIAGFERREMEAGRVLGSMLQG